MRLIDADAEVSKIKEEISLEESKISKYTDLMRNEPNNRYADYQGAIKQCRRNIKDCKREIRILNGYATAYDVDKVLEQMENSAGCSSCEQECEHDGHCFVYEIMDIIKAGGLDEVSN